MLLHESPGGKYTAYCLYTLHHHFLSIPSPHSPFHVLYIIDNLPHPSLSSHLLPELIDTSRPVFFMSTLFLSCWSLCIRKYFSTGWSVGRLLFSMIFPSHRALNSSLLCFSLVVFMHVIDRETLYILKTKKFHHNSIPTAQPPLTISNFTLHPCYESVVLST